MNSPPSWKKGGRFLLCPPWSWSIQGDPPFRRGVALFHWRFQPHRTGKERRRSVLPSHASVRGHPRVLRSTKGEIVGVVWLGQPKRGTCNWMPAKKMESEIKPCLGTVPRKVQEMEKWDTCGQKNGSATSNHHPMPFLNPRNQNMEVDPYLSVDSCPCNPPITLAK